VRSFELQRGPGRPHPVLEEALFQPSDDNDDLLDLAAQVERLERKLNAVLDCVSLDPASVRAAISHTRLLCDAAGYRLVEVDDPPPRLDETVEHDGRSYAVLRLGPSPMPGDARRCAVLLPA
jgi:hypothetical protein